jgi:hypothetical protein
LRIFYRRNFSGLSRGADGVIGPAGGVAADDHANYLQKLINMATATEKPLIDWGGWAEMEGFPTGGDSQNKLLFVDAYLTKELLPKE